MVKDFFERHRKLGYVRYDTRGNLRGQAAGIGPMEQEIWAHKTCDNQSTLTTGLAMIEGIYGRDGDGFRVGQDYLTNYVMFGKDKFRLDVIGLYLGGHEPGNVHLYRIAKERGLSDTFNPWEIPVYEWIDGAAVPRKLTDFQRHELKTIYLTRRRRARPAPGQRSVRLRQNQSLRPVSLGLRELSRYSFCCGAPRWPLRGGASLCGP